MEFFDVYDKERQKTGVTRERGAFRKGDYFLIVHVCVFNSNGEMLIQQRQPFKDGWSNLWDVTVGGHAVQGEKSAAAAERELFEEIGLKLDFSDVRPSLTANFKYGFDDYYIMDAEPDIEKLKLQYEEVKRVKWAKREEIHALIESGEFIPYHKSLIDLIFDMHESFGARFRDDWTYIKRIKMT